MNSVIEFSEEQGMLLETAMDFCGNRSPVAEVRKHIEDDIEFNADLWKEITELGWPGIGIPEQYGGLGMGLADSVPVVEAMGKHLLVSPFTATTVASQALIHGGSEAQKSAWLSKIVAGSVATCALVESDGDWNLANIGCKAEEQDGRLQLSGTKCFVQDAGIAELVIVSVELNGKPALVLLESGDIPADSRTREVVIDETRRSWQLDLEGIVVDADRVMPECCLDTIERASLLMLCAEMAGGIAGVLNVVVDYLKTRKQFDRYIGSYQSLKHPTVDILIGMEGARAHLYHAATAIAEDDERNQTRALRMAKAQASEAFAFAGDRAIQFHGGFGFTWECDAQLYLRRAIWCQYQFGDERHQRQLLAPMLLDKAS